MTKVSVEHFALGIVEVFIVESAIRLSFLDALVIGGGSLLLKLHISSDILLIGRVELLTRRIHQDRRRSNIFNGGIKSRFRVGLMILIKLAGAGIRSFAVGV